MPGVSGTPRVTVPEAGSTRAETTGYLVLVSCLKIPTLSFVSVDPLYSIVMLSPGVVIASGKGITYVFPYDKTISISPDMVSYRTIWGAVSSWSFRQ